MTGPPSPLCTAPLSWEDAPPLTEGTGRGGPRRPPVNSAPAPGRPVPRGGTTAPCPEPGALTRHLSAGSPTPDLCQNKTRLEELPCLWLDCGGAVVCWPVGWNGGPQGGGGGVQPTGPTQVGSQSPSKRGWSSGFWESDTGQRCSLLVTRWPTPRQWPKSNPQPPSPVPAGLWARLPPSTVGPALEGWGVGGLPPQAPGRRPAAWKTPCAARLGPPVAPRQPCPSSE